jgi:hypothetical protein
MEQGSRMPPVFALVMALLISAAPAAAQKNPPREAPRAERLYRGGLGVLVGSTGFGGALDLSVNSGARVYRFRLTGHDNGIASWQNAVEPVSISETALMVGRGHRFARNYGSVTAGLALVEVSRGGDTQNSTTTIGVPVEAQLISGGPLRLGATLAGNLNVQRPFAAFIMSVQIGRVPDY